jgi:hypothetical protein
LKQGNSKSLPLKKLINSKTVKNEHYLFQGVAAANTQIDRMGLCIGCCLVVRHRNYLAFNLHQP